MARKGTRRRAEPKFGDYKFVRIALTKDEKAEAAKWIEKSAEQLDKLLGDVLSSGHKCSFSYNETNQTVTCTFTGKPEESVNENLMLTSFASSWWQSLAVNLWKHNVFFKDNVWESVEDGDDFG